MRLAKLDANRAADETAVVIKHADPLEEEKLKIRKENS